MYMVAANTWIELPLPIPIGIGLPTPIKISNSLIAIFGGLNCIYNDIGGV